MSDLVEEYLDELYSQLRGSPRQARRLLAEAEDHLRQGVDEGLAGGLTLEEAQQHAVSSFGSVRAVVRAHDTRLRRVPGAAVLADLVMSGWKLGSIGLLAVGASGLVVAAMNVLFGRSFVAAAAPGLHLPAASCRYWLSNWPSAHSCTQAFLMESSSDAVSLRVLPGEVYAIIGANGAGKSTLLRTIAGLHHPTAGSISYAGKDVTRLRPEKRATAGILMVPEGRRLFPSLTLEENLKVGGSFARKGPWNIERVYELFPWMTERRRQKTAQMSGGEQQSVAIGRALVANPRVLLLDELSLGLAPVIVQRIYAMLPQVLESGITVLLVEQDVSQALRVATHLQCLLEGHTTLEGTPAEVTREQVEAAYFGAGAAAQAELSPPIPPDPDGQRSNALWPGLTPSSRAC